LSRSYAFTTKYRDLTLKITLCPLSELKPHELIVESLLSSLTKRIIECGVIYDPLIVDEGNLVVLDGMHRLEALKRIGVKFVPVCLVDYNNNNILLKRWFRIVRSPPKRSVIIGELRSKGLKLRGAEFNEANNIVNERKAYFALHWKDYSLIIKGQEHGLVNIVTASKELHELETTLMSYGAEIKYMTEEDAIKTFVNSSDYILITPILLSKEEVISVALKGDLLAPKSTRHVIPVRPLSINVPLEILTYSTNLQGALNWLTNVLSDRNVILVKGGVVVRDRKYEEDVLLFK